MRLHDYHRLTGKLYEADLNEFVVKSPKETMAHAKRLFMKARTRSDQKSMHYWAGVYKRNKADMKKAASGAQAGLGKKAKAAARKVAKAGSAGGAAAKAAGKEALTVSKMTLKKLGHTAKSIGTLVKHAHKLRDPANIKKVVQGVKASGGHEKHMIKNATAAFGKLKRKEPLEEADKTALREAVSTIAATAVGTALGAAAGLGSFGLLAVVEHFGVETVLSGTASGLAAHFARMGFPMVEADSAEDAVFEEFVSAIMNGVANGLDSLKDMNEDEVMALLIRAHRQYGKE